LLSNNIRDKKQHIKTTGKERNKAQIYKK